jgi:hypothetical protein
MFGTGGVVGRYWSGVFPRARCLARIGVLNGSGRFPRRGGPNAARGIGEGVRGGGVLKAGEPWLFRVGEAVVGLQRG